MNDQKNFNKPLDEWTEEEKIIETTVPKYSKGGRVEYIKKNIRAKERVMYTDPQLYSQSCPKADHYWEVEDKRNYVFKCKICGMKRRVFPISYEYKDGKLIHRISGEFA